NGPSGYAQIPSAYHVPEEVSPSNDPSNQNAPSTPHLRPPSRTVSEKSHKLAKPSPALQGHNVHVFVPIGTVLNDQETPLVEYPMGMVTKPVTIRVPEAL